MKRQACSEGHKQRAERMAPCSWPLFMRVWRMSGKLGEVGA